ncbi:ImmA/IrrE family metallo-endopeptidase [Bradyrhizobium sp. SRS-191]|uniref:ImmA/IrrE family metallo-endopeptidase n=1 Tax=Bradyrhizobium sp. SRS-191 TaxID=2962606 RepID=UPI00211E8775|nr:ImmA/IrrE family metallo-endopeptidase [Bradyrhizobium sp. SRS-191]
MAIGGRDVFDWIDDTGAELATAGFDGCCVDLNSKLLALAGVDRIFETDQTSIEARVERVGAGFKILIYRHLNDVDRRALLAHEVAHVVLASNRAVSRVLDREMLSFDRDLEFLVDRLAYSILVPKWFIRERSANLIFWEGFTLAERWRVPPKIAFLQIMEAVAKPGDRAIHLTCRYESPDQLMLFRELPKRWKVNWSLTADQIDGSRPIVRKGARGSSSGFIASIEGVSLLEDPGCGSEKLLAWMRQSQTLQKLLGDRRQIEAKACKKTPDLGADGAYWMSYVVLGR